MQKDLNSRQCRWLLFLIDSNIDIAYHHDTVHVVVVALSRRMIICGARLAAIGIHYEDQSEYIANWYLMVVVARLAISPTIVDSIRQTQVVNQLPK